ncbi:MerR family transcriptional regulator [Streptomyces sp. NPDC050738]|uniref:MerR family transcriptional regulator n=1 Tax=Streptomyces sp. NPDC050738 TaxID=3154744 RepID=UPI0034355871
MSTSGAPGTSGCMTWKVGPLAEASGLTVRTLHHWDTIGLLSPSQRTAGGHREYTEDDAARLYQVLALRSLGLGLESIALCLDAGVDPVQLIGDHLTGVEAELAELGALRERLLRLRGELSTGALMDTLEAMGAAGPERDRVLRRHLDEEQLAAMAAQGARLGPGARYLLEVEWPELYRRAEALRVGGAAPGDARVLKIVARMDELGALFSGGDSTASGGVRAAWRDDPAAMSGDAGAPAQEWRELADFLDEARKRHGGTAS